MKATWSFAGRSGGRGVRGGALSLAPYQGSHQAGAPSLQRVYQSKDGYRLGQGCCPISQGESRQASLLETACGGETEQSVRVGVWGFTRTLTHDLVFCAGWSYVI